MYAGSSARRRIDSSCNFVRLRGDAAPCTCRWAEKCCLVARHSGDQGCRHKVACIRAAVLNQSIQLRSLVQIWLTSGMVSAASTMMIEKRRLSLGVCMTTGAPLAKALFRPRIYQLDDIENI